MCIVPEVVCTDTVVIIVLVSEAVLASVLVLSSGEGFAARHAGDLEES